MRIAAAANGRARPTNIVDGGSGDEAGMKRRGARRSSFFQRDSAGAGARARPEGMTSGYGRAMAGVGERVRQRRGRAERRRTLEHVRRMVQAGRPAVGGRGSE